MDALMDLSLFTRRKATLDELCRGEEEMRQEAQRLQAEDVQGGQRKKGLQRMQTRSWRSCFMSRKDLKNKVKLSSVTWRMIHRWQYRAENTE